MRYFLPINNIYKIDLFIVNIKKYCIRLKVYLIYLKHFYFALYLKQNYFNISRNILYIKKLTINLLIIVNRSIIT